jgi:hypothetical protein
MRSGAVPLCVSLLLLAFAGCADSGKPTDGGPSTTAPPATTSLDEGSIAGLVTDDESIPLPSAQVAFKGAGGEAEAETDKDGRFTFNGLAAGSYTLFAQRLGYEATNKKVDVVAGETATVTLVLVALAVEEPRVETSTHTGFVDGDAYTFGIGLYYDRSFNINMTKGATEIVSSAKWDSTVPVFARYMRTTLTFDDAKMRKDGRSPLTVNITDFEADKEKDKANVNYGVAFGCPAPAGNPTGFVACVPGNPDALVPQIAYQQKIDFYNAVFYLQRAPAGYTGLP